MQKTIIQFVAPRESNPDLRLHLDYLKNSIAAGFGSNSVQSGEQILLTSLTTIMSPNWAEFERFLN